MSQNKKCSAYQDDFFPDNTSLSPEEWLAGMSDDDIFEIEIPSESANDDCDASDQDIDFEQFLRFEQRKSLAALNHLTQSKQRNHFSGYISSLLLAETSEEIVLFLDQLTYIVASQSMAAGKFQQFNIDKMKNDLLKCDEVMLLAALFGVPSILRKIATQAGKVSQELRFPESVLNCRKVLQDKYERRTYTLDQKNGSNNWFHYAAELKSILIFTPKAANLLHFWFKQKQETLTDIVFDYHNMALLFQNNLTIDFDSDVVASLGTINSEKPTVFKQHRKAQQVKQYCERHIKGQNEAISSITAMVATAFTIPNTGPCGIATFMGAPGSGKTVLAETLADSLNEVFAAGYRKLVLNMEMYSDDRSVLKLFGAGSQYTDSALGDLTTEVFVAPRTVIIIDEIEKAHRSVIQSLLTLIEKGEIPDQTTNKMVDFSQCFFIFTTNLGHKAATKAMSQSKQLDLNSLLAEKNGKVGLSSELISRLSRGNIALFRNLEPCDLLSVAEQAAEKARTDKTICWPDNFAELIVESLGGNTAPRAILSQAAKLQGKILDLVCSSTKETLANPRIIVDIIEDITDFNFVVVTHDAQLTALFKTQFSNCSVVTKLSQFEGAPSNEEIKTVLIHKSSLAKNQVISGKSNTKFYIFSHKNRALEASSKIPGIEKCYSLKDYSTETLNTFVQQAAKRSRLLAKISELHKRNMSVEFDYKLSNTANSICVTLQKPRYEQRFNSEDFEPVYMQEPCIPELTFDDLIGLDSLKQQVSFILQRLRGENDFVLDMPKGYLLSGLPGTGKSFFARAVAGECQVPFIPVNAADLMQGNVIENINHLFDVAERYAPCIVFLDEIDAIALNRELSSTLGRLAVNTLLTRMDGFNNSDNPVFVLAATNFVSKLDPAVMRHGRFDKAINFPLPDQAARKNFINRCAKKYNFTLSDSALHSFAKRISGAHFGFIETLFRDIQLNLLTEKKQFHPSMLEAQLLTATIGNKKTVSSFSPKGRLAIAYHETGHYLLSKLWYPNAKCTSLSIQEHEDAGGVTVFDYDNQEISGTKANVKARLQILLAGRAAEKLLGKSEDDISTGASHDIQQATYLAKMAISDCGFSDSLGLADFKQLPMLQPKVEAEVLEWLNTAYKASETYLQQNWPLVKCIAEALFEQETLDQEALDQATSKFDSKPVIGVY